MSQPIKVGFGGGGVGAEVQVKNTFLLIVLQVEYQKSFSQVTLSYFQSLGCWVKVASTLGGGRGGGKTTLIFSSYFI